MNANLIIIFFYITIHFQWCAWIQTTQPRFQIVGFFSFILLLFPRLHLENMP